MNRQEHVQWCKDRALQYVNKGDLGGAVTSMLSDLSKHPETKASSEGVCATIGMWALMGRPTAASIAKYINGFN